MKLKSQRWKNKGLWIALAALVYKILVDLGFSVSPDHYQTYVDLIISIVILLGIINDPNEGEWFSDTE